MLIVDCIIYSLQQHGGITVYFNELLRRMNSRGFPHRTLKYSDVTGGEAVNQDLKSLRLAERYRRCQIPDVATLFHSSYYRLPNRRIPVVTTVHDFTYEYFASFPRKYVHSWQKFSAIRSSDFIICVSENTRQDLLNFIPDVDPKRIYVVHNGVSSTFSPLESAAIVAVDRPRPYILYVGGRKGYKNFSIVLSALSKYSNIDLVCVGGGPLTSHEKLFVDKHLSTRFRIHTFVSDEELNLLYNNAYCLIYPSSYEGFGIPVLEAMRAGCPVIALNSSSIPEVAGDAALLIERPDVDELVSAINKLGSYEVRLCLRHRGFLRADQFSWEKTFEETLQIYGLASKNFLPKRRY